MKLTRSAAVDESTVPARVYFTRNSSYPEKNDMAKEMGELSPRPTAHLLSRNDALPVATRFSVSFSRFLPCFPSAHICAPFFPHCGCHCCCTNNPNDLLDSWNHRSGKEEKQSKKEATERNGPDAGICLYFYGITFPGRKVLGSISLFVLYRFVFCFLFMILIEESQ